MKPTKLLTAVLAVLLLTVTLANAKANKAQRRNRPTLSEAYVDQLLQDLKETDPKEAERIETLRTENPKAFHIEIRKLAWAQRPNKDTDGSMADFEKFRQRERSHRTGKDDMRPRGAEAMKGPQGMEGPKSRRNRFSQMETEFIEWLQKNESEKAADLAKLKESNPQAYRRSLALEMRKYRRIIDAEESNPELAKVLKKDLELKNERNEILEKLKAATDQDEKDKLNENLKEIVGERFDILVQKKQLRYEALQKKLEELKKEVETNQSELNKFKSKKSDYIKERVENIVSQSEKFNWE